MNAARQLQVVLVFALITRLLLLYCFRLHMTGFMLINSAAQNLIDGNGMGFTGSSPADLSLFYFEGLRLWPPLVTLTTALFFKLTASFEVADFLLVSITLIGLIRVLYLYSKEIGLDTRYIIYTFIIVTLNPELIKRPGFSDLAAALFCMWGLLLITRELKKETPSSFLRLLYITLIFFLPSAFRYQYYPVSVFFPVYLLCSALYLKDKQLARRSVFLLVGAISLIFLQEYFLFRYTAQPLNQTLAMDDQGFFPSNLKAYYPFVPKTFLNMSYVENTWDTFVTSIRHIYYFITAIVFLVFIVFTSGFFLNFFKKTKPGIQTRQALASFTTLPFLILPIAVLVFLSLTHNSRTGQPGGWTYVNEGRYYIVPSLLLLLLTIFIVQHKWETFSLITKRILTFLFVVSIAYNLALTIKFYYNIATDSIPDKELNNRTDRAAVYDYLKTTVEDDIPTVITYSEPYFAYFPHIKNAAITSTTSLLLNQKIRTTRTIRLLIISGYNPPAADSILINRYNAAPVLTKPNVTIYSTVLQPE